MEPNGSEIPAKEIEMQLAAIARARELFASRGGAALAFVDTYGCQQNESDSEKLRGMLIEMGFSITDSEKGSSVIVINTCAIRENAENRVFGNIGALVHEKRANPELITAVCGCMVRTPGTLEKLKNSYRHVDIAFGPNDLWRFPELLFKAASGRCRVLEASDGAGRVAEGLPSARDGSVKAWLPIMYGCDNFCSYCVVPNARGRERSRRPELILAEAEGLVRDGYRDITLLGQNVNSYGRVNGGKSAFPELLRSLGRIDGDFLIRFMTSHPKDSGEALFSAMKESERIARHIHLPFQSGNDRVLALMNRGYTAAGYLKLIDSARALMPDVVITSDVIVGFPGETEEEFRDTLRLIETAGFDALFTFIYSKRPGTRAAEIEDSVPREEKQRWFDELLELQNSISAKKHADYVGKTLRALVDAEAGDVSFPLRARTNGGRLVHLSGAGKPGEFVNAEITSCNTWSLFGRVV